MNGRRASGIRFGSMRGENHTLTTPFTAQGIGYGRMRTYVSRPIAVPASAPRDAWLVDTTVSAVARRELLSATRYSTRSSRSLRDNAKRLPPARTVIVGTQFPMETNLRSLLPLLAPVLSVASFAAESSTLAPLENPGPGIRTRFTANHNGLQIHVLEAGSDEATRPCVVLLHGFPELAYSWRHVMPALAAAGYYVVAPDQRGFGRTIGADMNYNGDLGQFRPFNLARDIVGLVSALGRRSVHVVGHDAGAGVAAWCAIIRPDIFRSVTLMTSPFAGPPSLPFDTARTGATTRPTTANSIPAINPELGKLPRPRKHYQWYYTTREANNDMVNAPQGLHAFLRGYFHQKSGDWDGNNPFPLKSWTAEELAKMPTYYIMNANETMAQTVMVDMPSADAIAGNKWLSESDLKVYTDEYRRTGFQGGLQWYRARLSDKFNSDLEMFLGRTIDVPSCYIAGGKDWGTYQFPGSFEKMKSSVCTKLLGVHLVEGAGHWVQQERPADVAALLIGFLRRAQGN